MNIDEYEHVIFKELSGYNFEKICEKQELLSLYAIDWNNSAFYRLFRSIRVDFLTNRGKKVIIWGYQARDLSVKIFIQGSGYNLIYYSNNSHSYFEMDNKVICYCTPLNGKKIEINFNDKSIVLIPPKSFPDWNSLWQSKPIIKIYSTNKACEIFMQPYRDNRKILVNGVDFFDEIDNCEILVLLSFSMITNLCFSSSYTGSI